jgi:hypothetical protein
MKATKAVVLFLLLLPALPGTAAAQTDAYRDPGARELVERARERRAIVDRRIQAYETTARERISASVSALARDRLVWRRETASRIHWRRGDTVHVEVLGAREVTPVFAPGVNVPGDFSGYFPQLAFDPVDSDMLMRLDTTALRHPLAADGEAHYWYASGDTTVIRLPDGRQVRLKELRVQPRRRDLDLVSGSFWLDAATHAVVQAYFTLARRYESERDRDRRGVLSRVLVPDVTAELSYFALEYGLWDMEWWLPRLVAAEGVAGVGGARLPLRFERTYSDYTVTGAPAGALATADTVPGIGDRRCRPPAFFSVQASTRSQPADTARAADAPPDTVRAADAPPDTVQRGSRSAVYTRSGDTTFVNVSGPDCERVYVVNPRPGVDLIASDALPGSIYAGPTFISEAELREIRRRVAALPAAPWRLERPSFAVGPLGAGLIRYNRVEALSVGARAGIDLGAARVDATLRYATADATLSGELGLAHATRDWEWNATAYRRLETMAPVRSRFGLGASAGALLLGRDEHDYFRTTGVELRGVPAGARSRWIDWRMFVERHEGVATATDISIRRAFDSDFAFRPNPEADEATQIGGSVALRAAFGLDPSAPRAGLRLAVLAEGGDYEFVRPELTGQLVVPLTRRLAAGLETAAGTSAGELTAQRAWRLGGASTLRGYPPGSAVGNAYWRARAELGFGLPVARLAVFSDIGWAGDREAFTVREPLRSGGLGISLLDGMLRFDAARPLSAGGRWRTHFSVDWVL